MIEAEDLRVVAVADPVRCGFGYPVLMQLNYEAGAARRVARTLAERSDVRFLALVTGSFDIVMEMIVPSHRYLARVLLEELPRIGGIKETTTETVLRNFKMSYDWSHELLEGARTELVHPLETPDPTGKPYALDAIDLQLYELLLEDGRRSFSDLAAISGLSESKSRRRVEALWGRGYIKFATLVEPYLLGYDVECFCWIRAELSRLEETAEALAALQEVRYLSVTIGHSDMICETILRSQDDLYEFSTRTLGQLPGIKSVDVGLELQTVKRAYVPISSPEDPGDPWDAAGTEVERGRS